MVWKSKRALGVSGYCDSGVLGSPILRGCSWTLGLESTAQLFLAKRCLEGSPDTGATVVIGCVVLGSSGCRGPPLAGSAGVVVWGLSLASRVNGVCGFRVPRRSVVLLGLRVGLLGVLTS